MEGEGDRNDIKRDWGLGDGRLVEGNLIGLEVIGFVIFRS